MRFQLLVVCIAAIFKVVHGANNTRQDDSGKRVVCYYTNWSVYRPGTAKFTPQNINPYLCTHLIYAFGGLTRENGLRPYDKYQDIEQGGYAKFTGLKTYNKNLKTMLAIGGWNEGSTRFSPLVADKERRREFVRNVLKFLRQNHFDGLDLDWEYPAFRDGGKPRDRDNYAQLVRELREEFDRESSKTGRPRLLLTMAVPAGIEYIDKGFDVPTLNRYLDFMNILSYDYHSAFEPAVNHHSPLYPLEEDNEYNFDAPLNIDHTISHYLEMGAERDKLVLGIPTYGRSYTLFNPLATELGAPADGPGEQGDSTREKGYLAYYEICENLESTDWKVVQPNPSAMGPYAFKGNQWVGYDDTDIVKRKARYVSENSLGGIMFWAIDNDDFRGKCHDRAYPLIEAGKEALLAAASRSSNDVVPSSKRVTKTRSRPRPRPRPQPQPRPREEEEEDDDDAAAVVEVGIKGKGKGGTSTSSSSGRRNRRPGSKSRSRQRNRSSTTTSTTTTTTTTTTPAPPSTTPTYNTPEPPTTPDPGSDFKCKDEGFFPHPRDCKKYFWCLDSGPSNLGIVAHQFTCPSGLFFNKAADSCDYTRNVVCKKPKTAGAVENGGSTTRAPITAATSKTTYINKPTRPPPTTSTTTTTTTEQPQPDPEEDDEEEYEEYDDEDDDVPEAEEDPQAIKELINLIKKLGGLEQLEKQLHLQDSDKQTTAAGFSKTLYDRVLSRNANRNPAAAAGAPAPKPTIATTATTRYTSAFRNRPVKPQNEGLEHIEDFVAPRWEKPTYVNIRRERPSTTAAPDDDLDARQPLDEEDDEELDDEEDDDDGDAPEDVALRARPTPEYVTIQRKRPSSTTPAASEEEEEVDEVDVEEEDEDDRKKYTSIRRARPASSAKADEDASPRYVTISRTRPTPDSNTVNSDDDDTTSHPDVLDVTPRPIINTEPSTVKPELENTPATQKPRRISIRTTGRPEVKATEDEEEVSNRQTTTPEPTNTNTGPSETPSVTKIRLGGTRLAFKPKSRPTSTEVENTTNTVPIKSRRIFRPQAIPSSTTNTETANTQTETKESTRPSFSPRPRITTTDIGSTGIVTKPRRILRPSSTASPEGDEVEIYEGSTKQPFSPRPINTSPGPEDTYVEPRGLQVTMRPSTDAEPTNLNTEVDEIETKTGSTRPAFNSRLKFTTTEIEDATKEHRPTFRPTSTESRILGTETDDVPLESKSLLGSTRPSFSTRPKPNTAETEDATQERRVTTAIYESTTFKSEIEDALTETKPLLGSTRPGFTPKSIATTSTLEDTTATTQERSTIKATTNSEPALDRTETQVSPIVTKDFQGSTRPAFNPSSEIQTTEVRYTTVAPREQSSLRPSTSLDTTTLNSKDDPIVTRILSTTTRPTFRPKTKSVVAEADVAIPVTETSPVSIAAITRVQLIEEDEAASEKVPSLVTKSLPELTGVVVGPNTEEEVIRVLTDNSEDEEPDTSNEKHDLKVATSLPAGTLLTSKNLLSPPAYKATAAPSPSPTISPPSRPSPSTSPVSSTSSSSSPSPSASTGLSTTPGTTTNQQKRPGTRVIRRRKYGPGARNSNGTTTTAAHAVSAVSAATEAGVPSAKTRKFNFPRRRVTPLLSSSASTAASTAALLEAVTSPQPPTAAPARGGSTVAADDMELLESIEYPSTGLDNQPTGFDVSIAATPSPGRFRSIGSDDNDDDLLSPGLPHRPITSTTTSVSPTTIAAIPRRGTFPRSRGRPTKPVSISTTVEPRLRPRPFTKVTAASSVTPRARTSAAPLGDYEYYDDVDTAVLDVGPLSKKVKIHTDGYIECLDQGNFPHPFSCKKFISCAKMENGDLLGWEYTCPRQLSFDPIGGICNWSAGLGCKE